MSVNANGTFVLFFANLLSKLFGAFYRLPLSNLLGAEGMGLYQMAFPIYSFLLTLLTGGISITLTRKIAQLRAKQQENDIYKLYILGRNTSVFFGVIFLILLLILAYPFSLLQGNTNAFYGYFAISIGFIFACLLGAYRGYYQGYSNMYPTAISQVLEQSFKLVFGLLFAFLFLKRGVYFGVFGALLGISLSEITSCLYFLIINKKHIKKQKVLVTKKDYIGFCRQVFPVSIAYVLLPLSSLLDSFLVVNLLKFSGFSLSYATSLYGVETGMILPLINMPNVLISAIALAYLPILSFKLSKNENIEKEVNTIFKTVLLFILPCCVGIYILARPIVLLIFPTLNEEFLNIAVNLLRLSVFEMFFLSFVTISNSLLQSLSKIKLPAINLGIGIGVKLVLSVVLISNNAFNIYGLVLASMLGYAVTSFINVSYIKKYTKFHLKIIEILAPIFSSSIMVALILVNDYLFNITSSILGLFTVVLVSIFIYFLCLYLLKQFSFKEVKKVLQTKGN